MSIRLSSGDGGRRQLVLASGAVELATVPLPTDVIEVEARIIGAIGPFRAYTRRETIPVTWEEWSDDRRVLRARTTVWDAMGQRYRGKDFVMFSKDGVPLWR